MSFFQRSYSGCLFLVTECFKKYFCLYVYVCNTQGSFMWTIPRVSGLKFIILIGELVGLQFQSIPVVPMIFLEVVDWTFETAPSTVLTT